MSEAKSVDQCRWASLETILRENYENPDIEAAKGFYSVVAGHFIEDYSPWLLKIAPSGSMKTDLIGGHSEVRVGFRKEQRQRIRGCRSR